MIGKALTSLKTSVFNWEGSYFGGHERVVYDHPFIYVPKEFEFRYVNTSGSVAYVAEKVCAMFLHRVVKYHLMHTLLSGYTKHEAMSMYGEPLTVLKLNNDKIRICLSNIIAIDTELANLFQHYFKFLCSIDILYYPSQDKDDKKGEGSGDGEAEGDGEEQKSSGDSKTKQMQDTLQKIKANTHASWKSASDAAGGELKDATVFRVMDKDAKPCKYSPEVVKQANGLVKLLDISFQPKEDRIENLKCGKMSAHKIAEIPAGNTHIYYRVEEDQATRPFSICVLADESGSMERGSSERSPHRRQNELMKMLYYAFSQILPQDKMFFFGHSDAEIGERVPEIRVYHDRYNPNFERTIKGQLSNRYGENYDGPVIECVYERVREQTSDNIIFISISDGGPSGISYGGDSAVKELKRVIEKCKRDGFVTIGIGLGHGLVKDIYNYHTIINDMSNLVKSVSSLINQVVKTEFKD